MRAVLLLMLAMSATAADLAPHDVGPWRIVTPPDWQIATETGGAALVLRSPSPGIGGDASDRARAAISVARQTIDPGIDSTAFALQCFASLKDLAPGFAAGQVTTVTIAGQAWRKARIQFMTGQLRWTQLMLMTVDDGTGWCVSMSSDDEHFSEWAPLFDRLVSAIARAPVR